MQIERDMAGPKTEVERPARGASRTPLRSCIVSRETAGPDKLVRFVVDPGGTIVPDLDAKLPGKGFWLLARRDIVRAARDRRAFSRAARKAVMVPDDLEDRVEKLLARRCLDLIGMARRAGQVWSGFEQVRAALAHDRIGAHILAADAAEDSRRKIGPVPEGTDTVALLDGVELGSVFGRERSVHVAVAHGRLAERLMVESGRLAGFRDVPDVGKLN